MNKTSVTLELAGKTLTLETGELAKQATSSILGRLGDTMVLVTLVVGKEREDIDYFPLTVEYVERLYAGGRIKGSRWVKREGRPSDDAILKARLIDRSIRPLFPKDYKKEVQIIVTVLSVDGENEPDVLAIIATSAALAISKVPWNGPIGATRVGFIKEKDNGSAEYIMNSGIAETEFSELDLIVSQTKEKTLMLEVGAKEVEETIVIEAISKAFEENKKIIALIEDLVKKVGQKKESVPYDPKLPELLARLEKTYKEEIESLIEERSSKESALYSQDLIDKIFEEEKMANPDLEIDKKYVAKAVEIVLFKIIRNNILKNKKRPDGRGIDDIRSISSQVSILPRTHGSAIFQRGDTQVLTVVTLGSPKLEQLVESAEGEEVKKYIHHYSMPAYSVGETGKVGLPTRREIGHGALAERALLAVIPQQEVFPYTIRVVTEVLSSNGSTSMASACGSTLALMDAGVPIKNPISGVAMGMMSNEKDYFILTDISGLEDFSGDMDFKVAGSKQGVTAIQLDVKTQGLTIDQVKETLEKAKIARLQILEKMLSVLSKSRTEVSQYAPKIELIHIPVEKIGELIGPGGKTIRNIISQTGATVDVEDDGSVAISGTEEAAVKKAVEWIQGLTKEIVPGEVFEGEVKRILPFGVFVEMLPGKEGMVHVSQMSREYIKNPNDIVKIGQKVKVRVIEKDEQGRLNLSMLFGPESENQGRERRLQEVHSQKHGREQNEHPLARQFRREREELQKKKDGLSQKRSRFRKDVYQY